MHTYVPSWLSAENLPVGSEIEEDAVCHITGGTGKAAFSGTSPTPGESLQHFAK